MDNKRIIERLRNEIVPALGCTEPIAVALAAAKAKETLGKTAEKIELAVSGNIFKNGKGVVIPGTGKSGLPLAAALGVICGNSNLSLELLKDVTPKHIETALQMVQNNQVDLSIVENVDNLYISCRCLYKDENAQAIIEKKHTNFSSISKNGELIFTNDTTNIPKKNKESLPLSVKSIYKCCCSIDDNSIKFLEDEISINQSIAQEGLKKIYGLQVGKKIKEKTESGLLQNDILTSALSLATAASDARMAGCPLPAMSNTGSGNQGITVSLPIIAAANQLNSDHSKLLRALALSNLIAIHIKSFLGQLSALCGIVVAATGACCGITYLLGGEYEQIVNAIKNMAGSITGMICDGAKPGCSLKIASGVSTAVISAILAVDGIGIPATEGIISEDIEETIINMANIGREGMVETDKLIINTMKQSCVALGKNS